MLDGLFRCWIASISVCGEKLKYLGSPYLMSIYCELSCDSVFEIFEEELELRRYAEIDLYCLRLLCSGCRRS